MGREAQINVHAFRSTFGDYIAEKTELDGISSCDVYFFEAGISILETRSFGRGGSMI